jgi:hypothetical protein
MFYGCDATAPQKRSGKAQPDWQYPASQETGSIKLMSAFSRAKEDACTLLLGTQFGLPD